MALQEREYARIEEGGVCTAFLEYDDVSLQITALIMRGNINDRSIVAAHGNSQTRSDGLKDQPEVRLDLSDEPLLMVNTPEGLKKPAGLTIGVESLETVATKRTTVIADRRALLKPRQKITR